MRFQHAPKRTGPDQCISNISHGHGHGHHHHPYKNIFVFALLFDSSLKDDHVRFLRVAAATAAAGKGTIGVLVKPEVRCCGPEEWPLLPRSLRRNAGVLRDRRRRPSQHVSPRPKEARGCRPSGALQVKRGVRRVLLILFWLCCFFFFKDPVCAVLSRIVSSLSRPPIRHRHR